MSDSTHAIFFSYASQDAAVARGIGDSLRAAGLEVWFDKSELRGGDAWDEKIRRQVADCALFIPIISANTARRLEGYFRLEWSLADQRTHRMARNKPFIVPVCIDATSESCDDVPESFSPGHAEESKQALNEVMRIGGEAESYQYAQVYAQQEDKEAAFKWLDHGTSCTMEGWCT